MILRHLLMALRGEPLLIESSYGNFEVVAMLANGGIAHWWRNNSLPGCPWDGPTIISNMNVEPILLIQLKDKKLCLIGKVDNRIIHLIRDDGQDWGWRQAFP